LVQAEKDLGNIRPAIKMCVLKCALFALLACLSCTWAEEAAISPEGHVEELPPSDEAHEHGEDSSPIDEAEGGNEADAEGAVEKAEDDEPGGDDEVEGDSEAEGDDEVEGDNEAEGEDVDTFSPEQLQKLHDKMDADNNSKVSLDEIFQFSDKTSKAVAVTNSKTKLQDMDKDKDGKLNVTELLTGIQTAEGVENDKFAIVAALEREKFKVADGNKDKLLDELEVAAFFHPEIHDGMLEHMAENALNEKDKDGDDLLTMHELLAAQDDEDEASSDGGEALDEDYVRTFKNLDKDGSGKLDIKELLEWESGRIHMKEAMQALMEIADTNKDKHVTVEEVVAAQDKDESSANYYFMDWIQHYEL